MRSAAVSAFIVLSLSDPAFAQDVAAQPPAQQQPPQDPRQPPTTPQNPTQPPTAGAEEGVKPTRNFASALVHNLGDDLKHLPRWNSVYWLAGGGAAALAIHPLDDEINEHLEGADAFFAPGKYIGETPTLLAAGIGTYLVGRGKNSRRLQHLGMDEIEGQILSEAIVFGLKQSVRRERPIRDDGTRASGFSFPSGHSAGTFAAATILQQHLGYKAGIPTYLVASYVAMSRLHDGVHNASDVVFGAAVGIVVGRTVTWHGRNFYASPMLVPKGSGIIVTLNLGSPVSRP
jgi:membrane-associated phospholipid phosphatase